MRHHILILLSLWLLIIFSTDQRAQATTWTYESLVETALKESPSMISAKGSLLAAELEAKNGRQHWLPTLDLTASHGPQGGTPAPINKFRSETSLLLTESLYDNGESYKNSRILQLRENIARLRYQDLRGRLVVEVSDLYFDYCGAMEKFKITERYSSELAKQYRWVTDQFRNGIKTRKDYLRFKAQSQRGELEVLKRQQETENSRLALFTKIGRSPQAEDVVNCLWTDMKTIADIPMTSVKPELVAEQVLQKQSTISDLKIAITERKYWPEVLLTAEAKYGSSNYIETGASWKDNEGTSWNALVTLKWNLWDWGVRRRQIDIQKARETIAESELRTEVLNAQKEWLEYQLALKTFVKAYKTAKDIEKMERENFSVLEQEYRMGRTSYLELITGLSDFLQSQSQALEYDYELQKHYLKSQYFQGKLHDKALEK